MKYLIDGGGYFPDNEDYAERQRERKIYLDHCEKVVKKNDVASRDYLIDLLKQDVEKAIATEYSSKSPEFIEKLQRYKEEIFTSWKKSDEYTSWFSRNCLQAVNTVSSQIAVLFTLASLDFREPQDKNWGFSPTKDLYQDFVGKWTSYEGAKQTELVKYLVQTRGIITVLKILSIDNIISQYVDRWYTCQVVYKIENADDFTFLPFEYIVHDVIHFEHFCTYCMIPNKSKQMEQFYAYIGKIQDKDKRDSVKMIYFLFLHEGYCQCFDTDFMEGDLSDPKHIFYSSNKLPQRGFFNKDNLLRSIPEKYIGLDIPLANLDRPLTAVEKGNVLSYLNTAMTNYLHTLEEFQKIVQQTVEPHTIDKAREERNEQIKSWKNKPIPGLLIKDGELTEECVGEVCGFRLWGGTRRKKCKKKKSRKSRKYPK